MYHITKVKRSEGKTSFADLGRFAINADNGLMRLAGTLQDLRRKQENTQFVVQVTATDRAHDENLRK